MDYVKAFVVGGIICAIVQILMEKTKLMPGRIMVMLVCTGALLGAVGIYGPFSKWAGAGANVPLLGFGNVLWKGVKEAVDSEGFIGLFKGGFKACAVGVSAVRWRRLYHPPQMLLHNPLYPYAFLLFFERAAHPQKTARSHYYICEAISFKLKLQAPHHVQFPVLTRPR